MSDFNSIIEYFKNIQNKTREVEEVIEESISLKDPLSNINDKLDLRIDDMLSPSVPLTTLENAELILKNEKLNDVLVDNQKINEAIAKRIMRRE